jgi:hypothetical protein
MRQSNGVCDILIFNTIYMIVSNGIILLVTN